MEVEIANSVKQGADLGVGWDFESPGEFADVKFEFGAEGIRSILGGLSGFFDEGEAEFTFLIAASDIGASEEDAHGFTAEAGIAAANAFVESHCEGFADAGTGAAADNGSELLIAEFRDWETGEGKDAECGCIFSSGCGEWGAGGKLESSANVIDIDGYFGNKSECVEDSHGRGGLSVELWVGSSFGDRFSIQHCAWLVQAGFDGAGFEFVGDSIEIGIGDFEWTDGTNFKGLCEFRAGTSQCSFFFVCSRDNQISDAVTKSDNDMVDCLS